MLVGDVYCLMMYRWRWRCGAWWWFYFQFIILLTVRWHLLPSCIFHGCDGKVAYYRSPINLLWYLIFINNLHTYYLCYYQYLIAIFIWQHSIISLSLAMMVNDLYEIFMEGGTMMMMVPILLVFSLSLSLLLLLRYLHCFKNNSNNNYTVLCTHRIDMIRK